MINDKKGFQSCNYGENSHSFSLKVGSVQYLVIIIYGWPVGATHTQLPGRLFSPGDIFKKLSHRFLLHFPIGMSSYDHHAKYQGVFP